MGLIAAKCTQCGANIEVDGTKETVICRYCGTAFIKENVLNNYNAATSSVNVYTESKTDEFEIDGRKLSAYKGSYEVVYIPEFITEIDHDAFRDNKKIKRVIVPDSVKTIGHRAFLNCENLEEIELPNSIFDMDGYGIFSNCKSLKKIKIPDNIRIIGQSMFDGCVSLEEIKIPEGVHTIKESAFEYCTALKNIVIPSSVKNMKWLIFSHCNLDSIAFENETSIEIGRAHV